jgi:SWIM/SEC-C metal-binding protein
MSKFFFLVKANNNNDSGSAAYGNSKVVRLGTEKAPAKISVQTEARKEELEAIFAENKWFCEITVDADKSENISDLEMLQSKVETAVSTKKANRNDPCPCGSEKKYKKCCGA